MKHYSHLTSIDREEISRGLAQGLSIRSIAKSLGRAPSSISRELDRNTSIIGNYRAVPAQESAELFKQAPRRKDKLDNSLLWEIIYVKLKLFWSPEQIAVFLKETYPNDMSKHVSHETIYRFIYLCPKGELKKELISYLRQHRRTRQKRGGKRIKRGPIPDPISIHDRPIAVESREVPGHWEGDLIVGKNHNSAIATIVERRSRHVFICRVKSMKATDVREGLEKKLSTLPEPLRATLTYDRGSEMAEHKQLTENLKIKVYFADPHAPWQRGTNENTNGLIRQFFPKRTSFRNVTQEQLDHVAELLNTRPRKTLEWRTPKEVFSEYLRVALKT